MASIISPSTPSDSRPGRFGVYGGRYVPETLMAALLELEHAYDTAKPTPPSRPSSPRCSPTTPAVPPRSTSVSASPNNSAAQNLSQARRPAPHRRAQNQQTLSARACSPAAWASSAHRRNRRGPARCRHSHRLRPARIECVIYMGDVDMERQELNVLRMRLLGAEVRGVSSGSKTLKDAISQAMRDWVTNVRTTYYLLGSALGAHPIPPWSATPSASSASS